LKRFFSSETVSDFPKRRGRETNTMFEFLSETSLWTNAVLST
jgi:hypothetical protein